MSTVRGIYKYVCVCVCGTPHPPCWVLEDRPLAERPTAIRSVRTAIRIVLDRIIQDTRTSGHSLADYSWITDLQWILRGTVNDGNRNWTTSRTAAEKVIIAHVIVLWNLSRVTELCVWPVGETTVGNENVDFLATRPTPGKEIKDPPSCGYHLRHTIYRPIFTSGAKRSSVMRVGGRSIDSRSGKIYADSFLALQRWRLCISRGSHDHVSGGAVSLTWSGTYKRTTEDDKLPGSDHLQCHYRPISGNKCCSTLSGAIPGLVTKTNKQTNKPPRRGEKLCSPICCPNGNPSFILH